MTLFVLVHGACHGAWCWRDIIPALEARGHRTVALDMPGRGGGVADLALADHARTILEGYDGRAVLVGHSAGGLSISAAAQAAPDRVERLVYVAALLPSDGDSLGTMMGALAGERAALSMLRAPDKLSYCFDTSTAGPALYNGASEEAIAWALPQICYEPNAPHRDALTLGAAFDSVPKFYVICTEDRVIPEMDQTRMAKAADDTAQIETGHSPFLSTPETLTDHLVRMSA